MAFGLTVTLVVLVIVLVVFGAAGASTGCAASGAAAFGGGFFALGAFVSVAVKEVFEAQTLANFIRFPMMFLGGVFVPVEALPPGLQVVARVLPLTYSVEALRAALSGGSPAVAALDLLTLTGFTALFFVLAAKAWRSAWHKTKG